MIRHEFNGSKFSPSPQPPTIVDTPWNQVTLVLGGKGDKMIKGPDIHSVIIAQCGFTGAKDIKFDFKFVKVRLWGLQTARPILMRCYGFDNTQLPNAGALCVLSDWPSKLGFPRVGFEFPLSVRNIVYSSDSDLNTIQVEASGDDPWLVYLDVLWRGNQYTPIAITARFQASCSVAPESSSSSIVDLVQ